MSDQDVCRDRAPLVPAQHPLDWIVNHARAPEDDYDISRLAQLYRRKGSGVVIHIDVVWIQVVSKPASEVMIVGANENP